MNSRTINKNQSVRGAAALSELVPCFYVRFCSTSVVWRGDNLAAGVVRSKQLHPGLRMRSCQLRCLLPLSRLRRAHRQPERTFFSMRANLRHPPQAETKVAPAALVETETKTIPILPTAMLVTGCTRNAQPSTPRRRMATPGQPAMSFPKKQERRQPSRRRVTVSPSPGAMAIKSRTAGSMTPPLPREIEPRQPTRARTRRYASTSQRHWHQHQRRQGQMERQRLVSLREASTKTLPSLGANLTSCTQSTLPWRRHARAPSPCNCRPRYHSQCRALYPTACFQSTNRVPRREQYRCRPVADRRGWARAPYVSSPSNLAVCPWANLLSAQSSRNGVSTSHTPGVRRHGPDGGSQQAEEGGGARLPAVPMGRRRPLPGSRAARASGGVVDIRPDCRRS